MFRRQVEGVLGETRRRRDATGFQVLGQFGFEAFAVADRQHWPTTVCGRRRCGAMLRWTSSWRALRDLILDQASGTKSSKDMKPMAAV